MNAMSKFSDAERNRIINETHATLARGEAEEQRQREAEYVSALQPDEADDVLATALNTPTETRNQRDRRELEEQEARFARERRAVERRNAAPAPDVQLRISSAIADERQYILDLMAEIIAETAARQREAIDAAVRPLQIELAELKVANAELKVANAELRIANASLSGGHGTIIDLPNPLRSVN